MCKVKNVDLLLIGEEGKRHYVFIKDFSTFMYDYTLHHEENFLLLLGRFKNSRKTEMLY